VHVLAFMQQMRAERHDAIARFEFADDRRPFVAEAGDVHGTPGHPGLIPFDQPDARPLARIEDRADRDLQRRSGPAVCDLDGDGRTERRVCQTALQHVASLERARMRVCGVRQLAQFRSARQPAAVHARPAAGSNRWSQRFRKLDDGLAAPGMRDPHDYLAGTDDLAGLGKRIHHHAIRVGEQHGVARFVAGHVGLGLGRIEFRLCRFGGGFHFVVGRRGNRTGGDEIAVSRFVVRGLARACRGGRHRLVVRTRGELQVGGIDPHERLAAGDGLPRVDQALQNLPGHAEPQVTLHPRRDDAGERTLRLAGGLNRRQAHEGGLRPRITGRRGVVAGCHDQGQQTDDD
jgi:hypothetical protein